MTECPSAMELVLWSEGKLSAERVQALIRHAVSCPECSHALSLLGQVAVLDQSGLLPVPSREERTEARQALSRLMKNEKASNDSPLNERADEKPSLLSRLDDFLFAGMLTGGVAPGFPSSGPLPALGHDAGNRETFPVRNHNDHVSNSCEATDSRLDRFDAQHGMEAGMSTVLDGSVQEELADRQIGLDGAPGLVSPDVQQGYTNTCAVRCQEIILRDFDIEISESELRDLATRHGWYDPAFGSFAADVGLLLEEHGVNVKTYDQATIFHLTNELAQGHRVIVGVDSGELWQKNSVYIEFMERMEDAVTGDVPDHAVLVSGVDISDPNHPVVVITDPGTGEVAAEYPLDQFLNAWEDSGFNMVATTEAPPQFALEHVHAIGGVPYDSFAAWYPSVEQLTGLEPFFDTLCRSFDDVLNGLNHLPALDAIIPSMGDSGMDLAASFPDAPFRQDLFEHDTDDDDNDLDAGEGLFT